MNKLFILLFFSFFGFSQTVTVNYIEKRIYSQEKFEQLSDFQKSVVSRKRYCTLTNSKGVSIYRLISTDSIGDLKTTNTNVDSFGNKKITNSTYSDRTLKSEDFYFKDVKNEEIIFKMLNGSRNFNGKDVFVDWNWKITDEIQNINGYNCKKAIGNAYNQNYIAWFTEDIAVSDGPNKISGLPGLIVYVSNPYFEYYATEIVIDKNDTIIEKPVFLDKTYTFLEINNIVMKNLNNNSTVTEGNTTIKTYTIGQ